MKINSVEQLIDFSTAYLKGEISMNLSKVARELNCDRKTVRRYLQGNVPKKTRNRTKYLDKYRDTMLKYLNDSNRHFDYIDHLYYFMKREHQITCVKSTFNRYIRNDDQLNKAFKQSNGTSFTTRFETPSGYQVQFDMKEKVKLIDRNGNHLSVYIPTLTLSWSRYNYRQIILNPTTDNLIVFLAKAFEDLGGVPKEIIIDNLKAFVEKPRSSSQDQAILNPKFEQFCKDYNINPRPCMPYRPQTKGKTETQNKIVDQLKNYNGQYGGILDMHEKLDMINTEDNERISQATRLPRIFLYKKEKDDLQPLPTKEIRSKYHLSLDEVNVSNESLIQYKYNKYSLPKDFISKRVGLAVQNNELLIYYKGKIIEKHQITTNKLNIKKEHNLRYESTKKEEPKEKSIILNELENIKYDND
jgi:transposase